MFLMKRPKIYLDTSVISYLDQTDSLEKSYDDCAHIANSLVHDCICIVSWNFKERDKAKEGEAN